ncbi:hypothetical protein [Beijerinckia indica]|uniref:hypothetical protein n=1 Tax=Beijerinckia indica TaxID=533 RepID=UPI00030E5CC2|nr:hypothetical protein [Beijerinckia indica]
MAFFLECACSYEKNIAEENSKNRQENGERLPRFHPNACASFPHKTVTLSAQSPVSNLLVFMNAGTTADLSCVAVSSCDF